uniref:N-terminal methionine N(alpha)-acetyltransferase NatC n=1 Tax=Daphnia similis TaxID=35528 RepID=A0A4Y7LQ62_9CRUS|nr:EOG090X07BN [Daphnia similis]SVE71086.1 EOG090X07BN [Daphnia similis]SVE71717.1 EOG090X07BN [Daphnia similis]SVE72347.1 EOG090X07BN [Daphnia similis]
MAPKKKPNKPVNNHQPSDPGLVSKFNLNNEATDSTCKNHQLNGHILTGKQMIGDAGVHLNGYNGTHLSDSSESSCSNIHTSSPQECTNLESGSSSELQMPDIMRLIQKDLSEPYSIYTYRYFIHNWPMLCYLAMYGEKCVGAIVCKLDVHKKVVRRGYIAMLAVDEKYRQEKIGSNLVMKAIAAMVADGADEVVLETEITNEPALRLYENLGFVRDKRLFRYYLNGVDALRLKLWLR